MKLVYSRRALTDLAEISTYYTVSASPAVAASIGQRLEDVIARISRAPESAPKVSKRSGIRVAESKH